MTKKQKRTKNGTHLQNKLKSTQWKMKHLIKEQMESKYAIIVYCHVPVRQSQCDTFFYFLVVELNRISLKKKYASNQ